MLTKIDCMVTCPECYSAQLRTKSKGDSKGGEVKYKFECKDCNEVFERIVVLF